MTNKVPSGRRFRDIMSSLLLHFIGILVALVVWTNAVPCAVTPEDGCVSCVKWRAVEPGHVYCKFRKDAESKNGKKQMSCERMKFANKICVEEKIGWPRCLRNRTVLETEKLTLKELGHTRRENIELNEGILKRNGVICVEGTHPEHCAQMVLNDGTKTCKTLREEFGLTVDDFTHLNPNIECSEDGVLPRTALCVKDAFCAYRHTVTDEDTCAKLQKAYKLSSHVFEQLNPGVQCNNLAVGSRFCVWSHSNRPKPNMDCVDHHMTENGDTCLSITVKYGRPIDELLFLNPSLDCSRLTPGTRVCTRGKGSQICARIVDVDPSSNCGQLISAHAVSTKAFYENNPLVDCSKLNETQQICGGRGYFEAAACKRYAMIRNNNTTVQTLVEHPPVVHVEDNQDSLAQEEKLRRAEERLLGSNNKLREISKTEPLSMGWLICTESAGAARFKKLRKIADALHSRSPELSEALSHYENNPSLATSTKFRDLFLREVRNEHVYELLMELNSGNATIQQALLEPKETVDRHRMCQHMLGTAPDSEITKCFCNTTQLYIYCYAHMGAAMLEKSSPEMLEPQPIFKASVGGGRQKRDICILSGFSQLLNYPPNINERANCRMRQCFISITDYIQLRLSGSICNDLWNKELLKEKASQLDIANPTNRYSYQYRYAAKLEERTDFGIDFCVLGSELSWILRGYEWCVSVFKLGYYPWKGMLTFGGGITFWGFFAHTSMHYFLYDVTPEWNPNSEEYFDPSVCGLDQFQCADFCMWRRNKQGQDRNMYASADWGFNLELIGYEYSASASGLKINEECAKGTAAFITIKNLRTCESYVEVECTESYGTKTSVVATKRLSKTQKMSFPIKNPSATYACTFVSSGNGREAFHVFGGRTAVARTSHFYTLQADNTITSGVLTGDFISLSGKLLAQHCNAGRVYLSGKEEGDDEPADTSSNAWEGCKQRLVFHNQKANANLSEPGYTTGRR